MVIQSLFAVRAEAKPDTRARNNLSVSLRLCQSARGASASCYVAACLHGCEGVRACGRTCRRYVRVVASSLPIFRIRTGRTPENENNTQKHHIELLWQTAASHSHIICALETHCTLADLSVKVCQPDVAVLPFSTITSGRVLWCVRFFFAASQCIHTI